MPLRAFMSASEVRWCAITRSDCASASECSLLGICVMSRSEMPGSLPSFIRVSMGSVAAVVPSFGMNWCASSIITHTMGRTCASRL